MIEFILSALLTYVILKFCLSYIQDNGLDGGITDQYGNLF